MENRDHHFVFTLSESEIGKLHRLLECRNWELCEAPYMVFKAKKEKTSVCAYSSGKLVAQGKEAADFVEFLLEPEILREKMFEKSPAEN